MRKFSLILVVLFVVGCKSGGWIRPGFENTVNNKENQTLRNRNSNSISEPARIGGRVKLYPEKKEYEPEPKYNKEENKKKVKASKKEKKKKKKRTRIYYTGDRFIRENKIHPFIGEKMIVMTILGHGKITRKKTVMRSPKIEVLGEDGMIALAHRWIRIVDPEQGTVVTGGYGEYFKYQEMAIITKSPKIVHTGKNGKKTVITSQIIHRDLAAKKTICLKNVIIRNKKFIAFAQKATYLEKADIVILEGEPRIFEKDNIYIADKMTLYNKKDEAFLEGSVQLIVTDSHEQEESDSQAYTSGDKDLKNASSTNVKKNKKKVKKKNNNKDAEEGVVSTIIYSDYGLYEFGPLVYLGKKVTFYMKEGLSVTVDRPGSKTYSRQTEIWGEGPAEALATFDVRTLYYEDGSIVFSEYAKYYRVLGRALIDTERNLKGERVKPLVFFFDKDNKPAGMIEAKKIERNLINERVQARGDVRIHLFEEDNSREQAKFAPVGKLEKKELIYITSAEITGEWAELFQNEEREVHVYGNSAMRKSKSKIFARKIILSLDTKRFEMLGSIHGELYGTGN